MSEELTPDNLIKAWQFQDEVSEMAVKMLKAGIDLGAKAMSVELLKVYIANKEGPLIVSDFERAEEAAIKLATEKMMERINNARGA